MIIVLEGKVVTIIDPFRINIGLAPLLSNLGSVHEELGPAAGRQHSETHSVQSKWYICRPAGVFCGLFWLVLLVLVSIYGLYLRADFSTA